jgi:protein arginine N-methyltransferase 7
VKGWGGLDLSGLNVLQDTASLVFTKQYGFRFSSVPHRLMTDKIVRWSTLRVLFERDRPCPNPTDCT